MTDRQITPQARPILLSPEMVRALLEGRKRQTRRVLNPQPDGRFLGFVHRPIRASTHEAVIRAWFGAGPSDTTSIEITCPYGQPGDLLYVRETWATVNSAEGPGLCFKADGALRQPTYDGPDYGAGPSFDYDKYPGEYTMRISDLLAGVPDHSWKPSIHMPRWASRLTLKITDVRVERVQDINEEDARAEGVWRTDWEIRGDFRQGEAPDTYREAFSFLWNSINEKRGYGWQENPWVWAISFETIKANVDDYEIKEQEYGMGS